MLTVCAIEFVRLQIDLVLHAALVWISLRSVDYIRSLLRSRSFYGNQPPRFRPLVRSGQALYTFLHIEMDLRSVHHTFLDLPRVQVVARYPGHANRWNRCELSRPSCCPDSKYTPGREWSRLEKVLSIYRINEE